MVDADFALPVTIRDHLRSAPRCEPIWPPGAAAVAAVTVMGCWWPIGNVADEEFRFCGRLRMRGSYCPVHRALAYAGAAS